MFVCANGSTVAVRTQIRKGWQARLVSMRRATSRPFARASSIELRLRELEFGENVSFLPLHHEHAPLGEADFHDLCEEGGPLHEIVHTMADVECVLRDHVRDHALRGGGS
jgi:hypothetical protein